MKKLVSFLLILILIAGLMLTLASCDRPTVSVKSEMKISEDFSGTRTISVVYPLSVDIDAMKDDIIADDPTAEIDGAQFSYIGVEEDGYRFELTLSFTDRDKYRKLISALTGRSATVFFSRKNTYLTRGTRMTEDFDVSELIPWVVSDTLSSDAAKGLYFDYQINTVTIGSDTYETASTVSINDCEGSAIDSVAVKTSNDKEGYYDRTFAFTVPNATYSADKNAIESYFTANTLSEAKYAGWAAVGSNMVYTVIYEDMNLKKMTEVTAKLLDSDSVEIFYGDRDNASTPLSEGLTFEENLDTFSFIGTENSFPKLDYSYSLPLNTTYGEGSVFENGRWVSAGSWENDLYTVQLTDGAVRLRIPDGIQYSVSAINFSLESLSDAKFRRSTDFVYPKSDGKAAVEYAESYFSSKGVACERREDDTTYTCHVPFEGTTEEITSRLVSVFGSGNFMAYEQSRGMFDLSVKTTLTDYVNLGYMLNSDNAAVPMNYSVSSEGGENIVSVSIDGSETAYTEQSRSTLPVKGGCATVKYHGNIPVVSAIVIYIVVGAVLLALTAFVCIMLMKPKKRRRYADPVNNPEVVYDREDLPETETDAETDPAEKPASLSQTTTFSILELNTLVRNKKYVDEIDRDVEARLREQSLEEQKQDIRAKELEDLSRKVYGSEEPENAEAAAEEAPTAPESEGQSE